MMLGILQARVSSQRLPGKVLKPLLGKPMLFRQLERIQQSKKIDKIVVATSTENEDELIEKLCHENNIVCYRGSLQDVLDRFYQTALLYRAEHVVRLTGDCPLTDATLIDEVISYHLSESNDYTSNTLVPTYPDGLDVEVIRFSCLQSAWHKAILPSEREHVTSYIYHHPTLFKLGEVRNKIDLSHLRWTVDDPVDFHLVEKIYESLYEKNPNFGFTEILNFIVQYPELQKMNATQERNAGLKKSFLADQQFIREKTHD